MVDFSQRVLPTSGSAGCSRDAARLTNRSAIWQTPRIGVTWLKRRKLQELGELSNLFADVRD